MWQTQTHIHKFTADGQLILPVWGKDGRFFNAQSIAIDGNDNVYVADIHKCTLQYTRNNNVYWHTIYRIQKFTSDGTFITQFGDVDTNGNPD